jgi:hypothetical protein
MDVRLDVDDRPAERARFFGSGNSRPRRDDVWNLPALRSSPDAADCQLGSVVEYLEEIDNILIRRRLLVIGALGACAEYEVR